jgi:spermidine synthase
MPKSHKPNGQHYLVEFFGAFPFELSNLDEWKRILHEACNLAKLEVLGEVYHQFQPQGITGLLLLSTSHISFHTWPEHDYIALDVFSCGKERDTKKAVDYLTRVIKCKKFTVKKIARGFHPTSKPVAVTKKLFEIQSPYQKIEIIDFPKLGPSLVLDGIVQSSEADHHLYDNAALKYWKPVRRDETQDVLILGGGDLNVATAILKRSPRTNVVMVEIDKEVVKACVNHLGGKDRAKILSHENFELIHTDALEYLQQHSHDSYNFIISDLTEVPAGTSPEISKRRDYYYRLYRECCAHMKWNGWLSLGLGSLEQENMPRRKALEDVIRAAFGNFETEDVLIPSFSETVSFGYAKE